MPPRGGLPAPKTCARFAVDQPRAPGEVARRRASARACSACRRADRRRARRRRRRRASSPRSAGAATRRRRPAATRGRSGAAMPSAISAAMPWPFGGISCRRWPQASMPIGSTHSGANAARSLAVIAPPCARACAADGGGDLAAVEGGAARRGDRPQGRAAAGNAKRSPTSGGRPCGRNASAQPGCDASSGVAATHFCWTTTGTA